MDNYLMELRTFLLAGSPNSVAMRATSFAIRYTVLIPAPILAHWLPWEIYFNLSLHYVKWHNSAVMRLTRIKWDKICKTFWKVPSILLAQSPQMAAIIPYIAYAHLILFYIQRTKPQHTARIVPHKCQLLIKTGWKFLNINGRYCGSCYKDGIHIIMDIV